MPVQRMGFVLGEHTEPEETGIDEIAEDEVDEAVGPAERDGAYHQGTVWAWLVGAYGDALLRAACDERAAADALLQTLTPLFTRHLAEAGLGSISEIFDGDPPHRPDGCIAQAWSVAESLRLLRTLEQAAPDIYARWETGLRQGVC